MRSLTRPAVTLSPRGEFRALPSPFREKVPRGRMRGSNLCSNSIATPAGIHLFVDFFRHLKRLRVSGFPRRVDSKAPGVADHRPHEVDACKSNIARTVKSGEDPPECRYLILKIHILAYDCYYLNTFERRLADEVLKNLASLTFHLDNKERFIP